MGVWAPTARIEAVRGELTLERDKPRYAQRRKTDALRRERKQEAYVGSFRQAVLEFLAFAACYDELAQRLADAVTRHATPVGSGTVARTERIPIHERGPVRRDRLDAAPNDRLRPDDHPADQRETPRDSPSVGRGLAAIAGSVPQRASRLGLRLSVAAGLGGPSRGFLRTASGFDANRPADIYSDTFTAARSKSFAAITVCGFMPTRRATNRSGMISSRVLKFMAISLK